MSKQGTRRKFLRVTGGATAMGMLAGCTGEENGDPNDVNGNGESDDEDNGAQADDGDDFPTGSIDYILPGGPGGGSDTLIRGLAPGISDELGVPINVLNRPGAGQLRAPGIMIAEDPDGYTIGQINVPSSFMSALAQEPDFDIMDLTAICAVARERFTWCASADLGVEHDLESLLDMFEQGEINGVAGTQFGTGHLTHEVLRSRDDIEVPEWIGYDDAASSNQALAAGEIEVVIHPEGSAVEAVQQDAIEMVGVISTTSSPSFPDAPTLYDVAGIDVDHISQLTRAILCHQDVPEERRQFHEDAHRRALERDDVQEWGEGVGARLEFVEPETVNDNIETIMEDLEDEVDLDQFT